MENITEMAKTIEKVRTGPKGKADEDKHRPVAFYVTHKEVDDFGGIDEARAFSKNTFMKELKRRQTKGK